MATSVFINTMLEICDPAIADNAEILDFVTHPTRTK